MTKLQTVSQGQAVDEGLLALCQIAGFYRIGADPSQLAHKLALQGRTAQSEDLVRAAKLLHLKARILHTPSEQRLKTVPTAALVKLKGGFVILGGRDADGKLRLLYLATLPRALSYDELAAEWDGEVVLVTRRTGVGIDPRQFGFYWFLPSIWRYRRPLAHVLLASLFVQVFALVNPLFFQIVVDKVLVPRVPRPWP
jgi:subfamily B ATP-binding cassette protein HlyB/CyaB